jgi:hypothetical protein
MRHQAQRCLMLGGLFLHRLIELLQRSIELVEQLQQLLPPPARPRIQIQCFQLAFRMHRPGLHYVAAARLKWMNATVSRVRSARAAGLR